MGRVGTLSARTLGRITMVRFGRRRPTGARPPAEAGPNPVLDALEELQAQGVSALAKFTRCEANLWADERAGRSAPEGLPFDAWHEFGARDLRDWLIQVGREVERLMGHNAVVGMRYQLSIAPTPPVAPHIRDDYLDVWQAGATQLEWLGAVVARGSRRREDDQW
jgi:hypothetical protein